MNCVTKRLCTPRTHSHDYGYWARACYEQGCEVFKKATQNKGFAKNKPMPRDILVICGLM